jgi:hypothetical protein
LPRSQFKNLEACAFQECCAADSDISHGYAAVSPERPRSVSRLSLSCVEPHDCAEGLAERIVRDKVDGILLNRFGAGRSDVTCQIRK